jgi:curved DNA-binding protein CbpA
MTDHFSARSEPRRPWLDADALKEKFHRLASRHHPDVSKPGGIDFTALNAAYQTLRDPKSRLRYLLELEFPEKLTAQQQPSGDIVEFFSLMGRHRADTDAFLARQAKAKSPLEQALLAGEKNERTEAAEKTLALLVQKQDDCLTQLQFIDSVWDYEKADSATALLDIYQGISYFGKWIEQVREDLAKLAMV